MDVENGGGRLAALAVLLARVGTDQVEVVNQPDQPVPVEPPTAATTDFLYLLDVTVAVAFGVLVAQLVLRTL